MSDLAYFLTDTLRRFLERTDAELCGRRAWYEARRIETAQRLIGAGA